MGPLDIKKDGLEIEEEIEEMKIPCDGEDVVTSRFELLINSKGIGWLESDGPIEDIGDDDVLNSPSF